MLFWKDDGEYDISYYEGEMKHWEMTFRNSVYNKDYQNSLEILNTLNFQHPEIQKIYAVRGMVLYRLDRLEESIIDLNKALELNPNDYYSWSNRGFINLQLKNIDNALTDCEESIRLNNSFAEGFFNLSCVNFYLKKYDESLIQVNNADKYKPANSLIYTHKGRLYEKLGNIELCIKTLCYAIDLDPQNLCAIYERATILNNFGEKSSCVRDYLKIIHIEPDSKYGKLANSKLNIIINELNQELNNYEELILHNCPNNIINELICPITRSIMRDPVIAFDGYSYERYAIELWFANGNITSPMTNNKMISLKLIPNRTIKKIINSLIEK
jgi:tetratricopeptide (TPR) repeat protein